MLAYCITDPEADAVAFRTTPDAAAAATTVVAASCAAAAAALAFAIIDCKGEGCDGLKKKK